MSAARAVMLGRAVCVVVAVGLVAVAPAPAQVPADAIRAEPNRAGAATHLIGDLMVKDDPKSGGQSPLGIFINVAAGFKSDSRAGSERCSPEQAANFACPENSKMATGFVEGKLLDISGVLPPQALFADVHGYLAEPRQPGDLSGIVFQVHERTTGQRGVVMGRVVTNPTIGPPYGLGLWVEGLDSLTSSVPPGFRIRVERVYGNNGVSRTVKKKRYKYVRRNGKKKRVGYYKTIHYDLLTNPRTCPKGGWPWSVKLTYPSGVQSLREAAMPCTR